MSDHHHSTCGACTPTCKALARRHTCLVLLVAAAVFAGSLRGAWLFDDHVAVKKNADVVGNVTLGQLFEHDFWGGEVASPGSHKSWRPLTVLVWRVTHSLWTRLLLPSLRTLAAVVPERAPAQLRRVAGALTQDGPHPFPFHALNVVMHALTSVLVLRLARVLFAKLHAASGGSAGPRGPLLQALLAALLFAVHPIHTEAVAGMVGLAELLCAALGVPALLLYAWAVERSTAARHTLALPHWFAVCSAGVLILCAALTKEIGITLAGTMVLYDVLLAPHMLPAVPQSPARLPAAPAPDAPAAAAAAAAEDTTPPAGTESDGPGSSSGTPTAVAARRQLLRVCFMLGVTVLYLKLRSWVMGRSTPSDVGRLENSLPYAANMYERVMSTGYVHARYAALLLLPHPLIAEWGFDCIPLVTTWRDPRNALTLALYGGLLYVGLAARPLQLLARLWQVVLCACGCTGRAAPVTSANGAAVAAARWRLVVVAGLVVAPFFPASNVLFYVGTTIGERLLYTPSIGFCLLAVALLNPSRELEACATELALRVAGCRSSSAKTPCKCSRGSVATAMLVALVLAAATARTVHRSQDWLEDDRLFAAAARDCPNSIKMRQVHGVFLLQHHKQPAAALAHFRHVQRVAHQGGMPAYCEPTYLIGLAEWELGNTKVAMKLLDEAMSCTDGDTAVKAMEALNRCYASLRNQQPANLLPLLDWASVLARSDVQRVPEACATAEAAAMAAATAGEADVADRSVDVCLRALQRMQESTSAAYADPGTAQQVSCVRLRQKLYLQLSSSAMGPGLRERTAVAVPAFNTTAFRHAMYKYVADVDAHHPVCRTPAGGGHSDDVSTHHKLLAWAGAPHSNDPWLQLEWGRTLLAANTSQASLAEAGLHLHAASLLFSKAASHLQAGQSQVVPAAAAGSTWAEPLLPMPAAAGTVALDGVSSLSPLEATEAAMRPLEVFQEAVSLAGAGASAPPQAPGNATAVRESAEVREAVCQMMQQLCALKHQRVGLLAALADDDDDDDEGGARHTAEVQAARAQHNLCLAQLAGEARCHDLLGGKPAAAPPTHVCSA